MANLLKVFIVLVLVTCFSCRKEVVINFDEQRGNIVGDWEVRQESAGSTPLTFNVSFNDDGTGNRDSFFGEVTSFEWVYQFNPEKVVIGGSSSSTVITLAQFYDITMNTPDEQTWTFMPNSVLGGTTGIETTWFMSKQ